VKKVRTAEEIILKLRKIETLVNQGKTIVQASKEEGILDYTYYRWRREYGGLNIDQAKELKTPNYGLERRGYRPEIEGLVDFN